MQELSTYDLWKYMDARQVDTDGTIDAAPDDHVLLQAQRDGHADRVGGLWIARGHIKPGERRVCRHIYGGISIVIGD